MQITDAEIEQAVRQRLANLEDILNPAPLGSLSDLAKIVLNRRDQRKSGPRAAT